MDSNEFWCRAFLAAMGPSYSHDVTWDNHGAPAAYCEKAADAALAVAQRRGMATGERAASARPATTLKRVEFTADRFGDVWTLLGPELGHAGIRILSGRDTYPMGNGDVIHIKWSEKWSETMPPKPIEVWIERPAKGGA